MRPTNLKKALTFALLLSFWTTAFSQEKPVYRIGILSDVASAKSALLLNKLKTEIRAVVGEDALIEFPETSQFVNDLDSQTARLQYKRALGDDTDIILAFGVVNFQLISKQKEHPKPTILFGQIAQSFSDIAFTSNTSGIPNLTYLVQSQSLKEDLQRFKELTDFRQLGFAIDKGFVDNLPVAQTIGELANALNVSIKLIPFENIGEINSNLAGLDALYLAGGFLLEPAEIKSLSAALIEQKIPSFTSTGVQDVELGLMATNQTEENFEQFFRRVALSVEAYINGTPMSQLPVYLEQEQRLTINYNTAQAVGVPIKFSLIGETDFVGEFRNLLSEEQYDLLKVIDLALQQNLGLQSVQKEVELTEQDVRSARTNYLPNITAAANGTYTDPDLAEISNGQNPEFLTAGNITLRQTVFSEAANASINIQKNLQKAQAEIFNAEQLNTIFDAANAYFNVLILKANAQIQIRNLDLTKYNLRIATENFEAGESGKTDVLRFKSQMAQNTQSMVEALNRLEQGVISLNQLLNNPLGNKIELADVSLDSGLFENYNYDQLINLLDDPTLREPFIEFLTIEARNNAPELKSINYNLEATDRSIRLNSAGRFLPTVALQGQYNRIFDRSGVGSTAPAGFTQLDDNYSVGLNVSIPIINQNATNVNRQIGLIQKDQLQINKENLELSIDANIRNTVLSLINELSNIELSRISEQAAQETLDIVQASYSEGAVNIVQLIDAQNNYLNAQLARANAVYNYLIRMLQLERFLGNYFLLNSPEANAEFTRRFLEYTANRE